EQFDPASNQSCNNIVFIVELLWFDQLLNMLLNLLFGTKRMLAGDILKAHSYFIQLDNNIKNYIRNFHELQEYKGYNCLYIEINQYDYLHFIFLLDIHIIGILIHFH
ncbi:hypothetical protein ACJX0J_021396, partial [Zea mays]